MTLVDESNALQQRVRAFAANPGGDAAFAQIALAIARFQAEHNRGFSRLVAGRKSALDSVEAIPAVPSDAFRLTRVAVHPPELDSVRFVTSGTSGDERGVHVFRSTATYAELAVAFGRRALVAGSDRRTVVALAPAPVQPQESSLGFMMGLFMDAFDGRGIHDASFELGARERWLLTSDGVDLPGLERAAAVAHARSEPLLLLATSFALVALLDTLGSRRLALPEGSVVMQTGGYKGRSRELSPAELSARTSAALAIDPANMVGEYGMTELGSQLYEGTARGVALKGPPGVYLPPPWLRVTPVDPVSLEAVAMGASGLARFVDLTNVDSAVAIVTRDLVRVRDGGIELLGRTPGAPPRGCSLAIEALLAGDGA